MTDGVERTGLSGMNRSVVGWVVTGIIVTVLYFTGYHTVVLGTMQRALL